MKSQEFEKLINNSYVNERQAIYEKLKQTLDIPDAAIVDPAESRTAETAESNIATIKQRRASKRRVFLKKPARLAACISMAAAVACLAIVLPFTLNNGSGSQPDVPPTASDDRFCVAAACQQVELKYSLREYSALNKLALLYVDWYDVVDIKTSVHVANEDQTDIIFYEEILKHRYTGSIVELYITFDKTKVDTVESYKKVCKYRSNIYTPYGYVYWGFEVENGERFTYMTWFRYKRYVYTLVLRYPMSENDIFELIDSILPQTIR